MNYSKKVKLLLAVFVTLVFTLSALAPLAGFAANQYKGLDIVIVVDDSGSMKKSDPANLAAEAIRKTVDASNASTNRFSIARYEAEVDTSSAINLTDNKNEVKTFVDPDPDKGKLKRKGQYTDAAAGVNWAVNQLTTNSTADNLKAVILIGDGENDFTYKNNSHPTRDESVSDADLANAITNAQTNGIEVYTFAICNDPSKDAASIASFEQYFSNIAQNTSGKAFKLEKIDDVNTYISQIVGELEGRVQPVIPGQFGPIHPTPQWQTTTLEVPADVFEMNLQCEFNKAPVEFKFTDPNGNKYDQNNGVIFVQDQNYNNYKISAPVAGPWTVEYRSDEEQNVEPKFTFYSDNKVVLSRDPGTLTLGQPSVYTAKASDRDGNPLDNATLSDGMEATLVVCEKDADGNVLNTSNIKMNLSGDVFTIENTVTAENKYDIYAELKSKDGKVVKSNVFAEDFSVAQPKEGKKGPFGLPLWLFIVLCVLLVIILIVLIVILMANAKKKPGSGPVRGFVCLKITGNHSSGESMIFPVDKFDCLQVFQARNTLTNLVSAYVQRYRMNNTSSLAEMSITQFINAAFSEVTDKVGICGNKKKQTIVDIPAGYDMQVDGMDVMKPRRIIIGNMPEKTVELRFKNQNCSYTVQLTFIREQ